jgi:hypothetical protein
VVTIPYGQVDPPPALLNSINTALGAAKFPRLSPSIAALPNGKVAEWATCTNVDAPQLARCTFPGVKTAVGSNSPAKSVLVIGDSIGTTWLPAIRSLQAQGYTIYAATYSECPAADVSVYRSLRSDTSFTNRCNTHRQWAIGEVSALHPDIVVLANSLDSIDRLASGVTGDSADAEWAAGTARTITAVQAAGAARIVLISPPPPGSNLQSCTNRPQPTPGDCVAELPDKWTGLADAERQVSQAKAVTYLDVHLLFCAVNNYCPAFVGTMPVRVDGNYLTQVFSAYLGPILAPLIIGSA